MYNNVVALPGFAKNDPLLDHKILNTKPLGSWKCPASTNSDTFWPVEKLQFFKF